MSRITKKLGKDDSYKVATPTSLAAVRGTDFIVSEENGKSYIACTDGKVFIVKNSDKSSVDIDAGQEVYVEPDKRLTVKDLSEENRRGIENILDEISKIQEDIRKRFDEERERIRDDVRTMKDENKEKVDEQRKTDKQNVSNQKAADKANRDAIAGAVKDGSDEAKKAIEDVKPDINSVKPQIKKPQVKPSGE
ncbi:MAG: FecR family protein [Spirochaetia bacterium]|nr:FecR family protein [Spirochaetia bacterium]